MTLLDKQTLGELVSSLQVLQEMFKKLFRIKNNDIKVGFTQRNDKTQT